MCKRPPAHPCADQGAALPARQCRLSLSASLPARHPWLAWRPAGSVTARGWTPPLRPTPLPRARKSGIDGQVSGCACLRPPTYITTDAVRCAHRHPTRLPHLTRVPLPARHPWLAWRSAGSVAARGWAPPLRPRPVPRARKSGFGGQQSGCACLRPSTFITTDAVRCAHRHPTRLRTLRGLPGNPPYPFFFCPFFLPQMCVPK